MASEDGRRAEAFLADFVKELTVAFPSGIEFIGVGGSTVRGDFRLGSSDIDMLVFVRDASLRGPVGKKGREIFWRLDEEHGLRLKEAYAKKRDEGFLPFSRSDAFREPFKIASSLPPPPTLVQRLLGPFDINGAFFRELKHHSRTHGIMLYPKKGKMPPLKENTGFLERVLTYSFFISVMAAPLSLIWPERAYKRSSKAVIFAFEDSLFPAAGVHPVAVPAFALSALYSKKYPEASASLGYAGKVVFCLKAPIFICAENLRNAFSR